MITPKFRNNSQTQFYNSLKERINDYFRDNKIERTGNFQLYLKAIILVTAYVAVYVHLVFFTPPAVWAMAECLLMGILTSSIGFNVMHDGAHGSFSRHTFFNEMAALSANMMGASSIMWKNKHNIIHHTYTNIDGVDDDIEIRPMLRMCPSQKRLAIHRFQHIYVWVLYSLLLLFWLFFTDYQKYFRQKVGSIPLKKMSFGDHVAFWIAKAGYAFMMIALPIYLLGFTSWLIGFLILTLSSGLILSIVFQLAHTVEETAFPVPDNQQQIENEWAIHQLQTTANFATKNKIISWFVGGLNFQIEHHLFPKISHVHYPAISKIIRETCDEFKLNYIEHPKMTQAIASHSSYLKKMGTTY
jgi:linoleoyl-CoA desaturase